MLLVQNLDRIEYHWMMFVSKWSFAKHFWFASLLRLVLIVYGAIHDHMFTLKYTDIDYHVFTDGSKYLLNSQSPFSREGYRYTPLFALLTIPNLVINFHVSKIIFAAYDVLSGYLIYLILVRKPVYLNELNAVLAACLWFYNPLSLIVCTRGSNDSFVVFHVLLSLILLFNHHSLFSGLIFGICIHCKLYPVILFPIIYLFLSGSNVSLLSWKTVLPLNRIKLTFSLSALISFCISTYYSYVLYGQAYVDEAWLYHLNRKDLAHNFSPYFYLYQLSSNVAYQHILSYLTFVPQVVSILFLSTKHVIHVNNRVHPLRFMHLFFALFMTTFLFVTFNKVCTSQYFLWYLSLLPLISAYLEINFATSLTYLSIWLLAQGIWLTFAYAYEFMHFNVLPLVWLSSLLFMMVNLFLSIQFSKLFHQYIKKFDKHIRTLN